VVSDQSLQANILLVYEVLQEFMVSSTNGTDYRANNFSAPRDLSPNLIYAILPKKIAG